MVRKKLQNYISSAVGDGTVAPATAVGHVRKGSSLFSKFVIFCLNSDGGKLYMKMTRFRVTIRTLNSRSLKMRTIEFIMIYE
jgi:hypothetical protein